MTKSELMELKGKELDTDKLIREGLEITNHQEITEISGACSMDLEEDGQRIATIYYVPDWGGERRFFVQDIRIID